MKTILLLLLLTASTCLSAQLREVPHFGQIPRPIYDVRVRKAVENRLILVLAVKTAEFILADYLVRIDHPAKSYMWVSHVGTTAIGAAFVWAPMRLNSPCHGRKR